MSQSLFEREKSDSAAWSSDETPLSQNHVRRTRRWVAASVVLLVMGGAAWWIWSARQQHEAEVSSTDSSSELTLPEADRDYLWEVEHRGSILSQRGFPLLTAALAQQDSTSLREILAADFLGELPQASQPLGGALAADSSGVRAHRTSWEEADRSPANADAFIHWLLQRRSQFAQLEGCKADLMALRPAADGDWEGQCRFRLWGRLDSGNPAEAYLYLRLRLHAPEEEQFQAGEWLLSAAVVKETWSESKIGFLFKEVAAASGFPISLLHDNWNSPKDREVNNSGGGYLCDYNRDGVVDLLLVDMDLAYGWQLFRGEANGAFVNVTRDLGLSTTQTVTKVAVLDLDGDGWEDFVAGTPWRLLRNDQGRRFEDVTSHSNLPELVQSVDAFDARELGIPEPQVDHYSGVTGFAVADFDRDGQMDLYVTRIGHNKTGSWVDGKTAPGHRQILLRNEGNWRFSDVTLEAGADGGQRAAFTATWLDANNDTWPDLFVINEFGNGVLLVNQGDGKFRQQEIADGSADFGSMGLTVGDLDNDENIDVYVSSMYSKAGTRVMSNLRADAYSPEIMQKLRNLVSGSKLYRNRGGMTFEETGADDHVNSVGWAWGAALVDFDNDGFLDLFANAGYISRDRSKPDG